ncbi:MAG: hypothetical protein QY326_07060 [Bdellovibrionota bacterium]|nr:MAG: hypothetical protein QY326_07060 [Bdellovibrionota bacterium]
MDQSRALNKLNESADLIQMIESLLDPGVIQHMSPSTISGMRITLRNIRESVMASHNTLASNFVARNRATEATPQAVAAPTAQTAGAESPITKTVSAPTAAELKRRDLRASLEKIVMDRQQ